MCCPSAFQFTVSAPTVAVFAITITLLVLEIKALTDYTNLLHGLAALCPSHLAYTLTFPR